MMLPPLCVKRKVIVFSLWSAMLGFSYISFVLRRFTIKSSEKTCWCFGLFKQSRIGSQETSVKSGGEAEIHSHENLLTAQISVVNFTNLAGEWQNCLTLPKMRKTLLWFNKTFIFLLKLWDTEWHKTNTLNLPCPPRQMVMLRGWYFQHWHGSWLNLMRIWMDIQWKVKLVRLENQLEKSWDWGGVSLSNTKTTLQIEPQLQWNG